MAGTIGKGQRSIAKASVAESLLPAVGFTKLLWKHEASAGDTVIDLFSLTTPASATAEGYVAPSVSALTAVNLQQFQNNLRLESSAGPLSLFTDYKIIGASKILLLNPALDGEIFTGTIDYVAVTGNNIVNARSISVTGSLAAGVTDFNIGEPIRINQNPSSQHGAVLVYVDGQLMYRNSGNQPSGPGVDGDYYEVHSGAGLGSVIRFNAADLVKARQVSVVSNGALVEQPSGSQQAYLDALQGQLNVITETVEDLAGVPAGSLQSTPTTADLKTFGDRVLAVEQITDEATGSELGTVKKNRFQTKYLSAPFTTDNADIGDLQFNNLTIGKWYRLSGAILMLIDATDLNLQVSIRSGAGATGDIYKTVRTSNNDGTSDEFEDLSLNIIFQATSSSVYFNTGTLGAGSAIEGDGTTSETFVTLEELNNYEPTTAFS